MHKIGAGMTTTVQQEWSWKVEPVSPPPLSELDTDNWFTASTGEYLLAGTNCDSNSIIVPDPIIEVDSKPLTRAETATRLLNDLNEWIKEEPFSDWYEEKIDLPIFEELESVTLPTPPKDVPVYENKEYVDICSYDNSIHPAEGKVHIPAPNIVVLPESQPRPELLPVQLSQPPVIVPVVHVGEQTSVLMQEFDFVLNNHETLTPPESPRDDGMNLIMLQDMRTEELDELVRIRVESLVEGPDNSCSSSSLHEDSSADSPASSDSGYDDPDWTPAPVVLEPKQGKRRRTTKPYTRAPPEEKRQRKKEQNKNAATRYRQKKKLEVEEILGEEKGLEDKNQKLKTDVSELAREIKYLKNLMREVFKAKGLIK